MLAHQQRTFEVDFEDALEVLDFDLHHARVTSADADVVVEDVDVAVAVETRLDEAAAISV